MGRSEKAARALASFGVAAVAAGVVLTAGGDAQAQVQVQGQVGVGVQVGGGYSPPPPVYAQPQPVYVQQPQPVYVQQPAVYQQPVYLAQPQMAVRRGNVGRFRYGIDAGAGWQFMDYASGFNITASMRLGWQLNDQIAIFYQTDLPIGFVTGRPSSSSTEVGGASIIWGNAVMGEYTLNDFVSFAVGPSVDIGLGAICDGSVCLGAGGTFFGIQSRISFNLVPQNQFRRAGFRVGLGGHTTFMAGVVVQSLDIHLGWELM